LSILDPFGRLARFQQSTEAVLKSRFWAVALACFLVFCVAPVSALAGSITGKITAVGGAPIPHARACVHDVSGSEKVTCAQADGEGDYAITAIAPDEYKLYFEEPQGGPEYVVSYWPEKATFDEGVPFQIASGDAIERNATLVAAGRIEGTLTGEGEVLASGEICAYKGDGIRVACTHVAGESGYRIRDLAPGSYVVEFTAHGHLPEYSGGVKEFADATPVTVQAGAAASASADLESEPGVSGTVTALDTGEPIEGVQVCVEENGPYGGCVTTDEGGKYTFYLFPGTYSVRFELDGYVTQYYDDVVDSADATTVTTTYGSLVRGVDAALEDAGSITGHVTTTDGQADLGDVMVCALGASSEECVGARQQTGAYEFLRLAPGSYKVRFSLERHFTQYFDDKPTEAEAQSVTVTADHETGGIDATLVAEEAPTNVTPPFVGGVGKIGETLSCSNGVWSGNPPIFTYEYFWFRGEEEEIEGAESSTYRLGIADAGEAVWCAVVATNSAGEEYEFSSNEILVPWLGTLTVAKTGGGTGTVSSAPAGIICGVTCAAVFEEGTAITLTAVADSGSEFTGWSGACSGTGPCALTLGEGAEVIANFARMRSVGGSVQSPTPPATPAPAVRQSKKPLRCKAGFRKEKHKGKIRCVKAKPRHKGSPEAKRGRA
jgi:Carboxypeptidase regulatory-like domain/Divergent InlB B-repeat domain